ncbi:MAG: DUF4397 domain-containing protein [Gemmatimonadota bacterium]
MMTRAWKSLTVVIGFGGFLGCSNYSSGPSGGGQTADLRIAQTVWSATSLRVRVGTTWSAPILPGSLSSVLKVPVGTQSLLIETTGGTATGSTQSQLFEAGKQYLLVAQDSAGIAVPSVLPDTGAAPVAGKSKLRVIHSAALAPAIDIWRRQPDYDTLVRVQFPFPYRAVSPYIQSDPGSWHITVSHENLTDTLYASGTLPIGAGKLVTVIVLDSSSSGGITAMVVPDN